jgi:hypothetical protein
MPEKESRMVLYETEEGNVMVVGGGAGCGTAIKTASFVKRIVLV